MLDWIVRNRTVWHSNCVLMLNWIVWNRNVWSFNYVQTNDWCSIGLVWWHIKHCKLLMPNSFLYIKVLFQAIQFSISTQFSSIWPIDRISGVTTLDQSELGSDSNEKVLHIPQSSSNTGTSPSVCLASCTGYSWGGCLNPLQRSSWCVVQPLLTRQLIELLAIHSNTWKYKTVCKQMSNSTQSCLKMLSTKCV